MSAQRLLPRLLLLLGVAGGIAWATFNRDRLDLETLDVWLFSFGLLAPFAYLGLYAVGTIAFVPGTLFALAGGALFGPVWGSLLNLVGATLGGSLAANDSADDLPAAVLALDAEVHVTGSTGARTVAVGALLTGAGQTSLAAAELITAVTLPRLEAGTGTAYEKVRNPATLAAVCGVAAALTLAADGTASSCRVSLVGAARSAIRLPEVESALLGQKVTAQAIEKAAGRAAAGVTMRNDLFATAEYRAHLAKVMAQRALTRAFERASR